MEELEALCAAGNPDDEVRVEAALVELHRQEKELMRRKLAKDYPPAGTRRDAHPKHTGLLEGVFTVDPALPADLRVGLVQRRA